MAVSFGQTLGCRSNFDGVDVQAALGVGPGGIDLSGVEDGKTGNEGVAINIGPSLGYETHVTGTSSFTIGDIVRGVTAVIMDSDVPWHGDDGCSCK